MASRLDQGPMPGSAPRLGATVEDGPAALAAAQALAQQQAAFERQMEKDRDLFVLHLAMGWTTYLMVPATAIAAFVYPISIAALLPLTGLSVWNWRRMLRRDAGDVEPITPPPTGIK